VPPPPAVNSLTPGGLDPKWKVNYSDLALSKVIGEGAFGQVMLSIMGCSLSISSKILLKVYKGTLNGKEVAVKLVKIGADTPDFKEDFVKEVTFLRFLLLDITD